MDATPPAWVRKRDGRLEPFDADKISRALFAASETLGQPNAFLARELTDGVVHFLTQDADDSAPSTNLIAELVAKVVRELGQPALAAAFTEHGLRRERGARPAALTADAPRPGGRAAGDEVALCFPAGATLDEVLSTCVRAYTLQTVFARDLAAAQADGLLTLAGLDVPGELAGCVLGPPVADPAEDGVLAALEKVRRFAGDFVALDSPEYLLLRAAWGDVRGFARDLALGLRLTGLRAVVHLNCAAPPSWAGDLAEGPLFAGQRLPAAEGPAADLADELARELLRPDGFGGRVRIDWRLGERDFRPAAADRIARTARQALDGSPIAFVFDRPRRPIAPAEGLDRPHPGVLMTVGVHLPRLAEQGGVDGDPARFLKKLGSLARLALSAAVQKREFLRRHERASGGPPITSGFLLDRAPLVVAPVGLDAVVQGFTGGGMCSGAAALDLGKQIVQALRDVLRQDGGRLHLPTCLDGPADFRIDRDAATADRVAGLTAWEPSAPVKSQLRAAGALHAIAERGTAALFLPDDPRPTVEDVTAWLRAAWKQTDVTRVRLMRREATTPQPMLERKG